MNILMLILYFKNVHSCTFWRIYFGSRGGSAGKNLSFLFAFKSTDVVVKIGSYIPLKPGFYTTYQIIELIYLPDASTI